MKKHLDIIIGMTLLAGGIISCMGSDSDCGNAKVVRGTYSDTLNQDSVESAYWHTKSDSMISAIKAKSERRMNHE